MHLSTIALASFLAVAANALPSHHEARGLNVICSVASVNEKDETNGASPLIKDCETMRDNIKDGGDWTVFKDSIHHELIQFGTCVFGVDSIGVNAYRFKIGNGDITNMITNSIRNYGKDGRVGASGEIDCAYTGADGTTGVRWNILHS